MVTSPEINTSISMGLCCLLAITKNSDQNHYLLVHQRQFVTSHASEHLILNWRSCLGTKEVTLQNMGSWKPIVGMRDFLKSRTQTTSSPVYLEGKEYLEKTSWEGLTSRSALAPSKGEKESLQPQTFIPWGRSCSTLVYIGIPQEALQSADSKVPSLKTVSSGGVKWVLEFEFLTSITAASEEGKLGPPLRYIAKGMHIPRGCPEEQVLCLYYS